MSNHHINIPFIQIPRLTLNYISDNKLSDKNDILDIMDNIYNYETTTDEYGIIVTIDKNIEKICHMKTFEMSSNIGRLIAEKTIDYISDNKIDILNKDKKSKLIFKIIFIYKPEKLYIGFNKSEKEIYEKIKNLIIIGIHGIIITFELGYAIYSANNIYEYLNIKEFTLELWLKLIYSQKLKGKIIKVERYKCEEYLEYNNILLENKVYFNTHLPILLLGLSWLSYIK